MRRTSGRGIRALPRRWNGNGAGPGDDGGFSLSELLVASAVGLLVLGVVGSAFELVARHQRTVVHRAHTVADAQVAFADVRRAVRNSATNGVHVSGDGLVVHTRSGDATGWRCRAWRWVEDGPGSGTGSLYTTTAATGTDLASVTDPVAESWTLAVADSVSAAPVFGWGLGGAVEVDLVAADPPRVDEGTALSTTVLPLPQDVEGDGGCF